MKNLKAIMNLDAKGLACPMPIVKTKKEFGYYISISKISISKLWLTKRD
ncbi:sulfurtransferase TusA family protein [Bacillus sp. B1-b2]|nr:hypothetical protein [Bacillus sp. B1-b2]